MSELTAFAERGGYDVVGVFKETASGAAANRAARNRVLDLAQARQLDAILVSELSRPSVVRSRISPWRPMRRAFFKAWCASPLFNPT